MKLTEIKAKYEHYFRDEDGIVHGLYQYWHANGTIWVQRQHDHGILHGESKFFYRDGSLRYHEWYEHNKQVLNFLKDDKYPTSKEEIFIHKLTYQGEFIPRLTEIKERYEHYFRDEDGNVHGLYQYWHANGTIWVQRQFNHGLKHGESKFFYGDGSLRYHEWYEHDKPVLDFSKGDKYPTDEDERLIFKLTYQGEFLPK